MQIIMKCYKDTVDDSKPPFWREVAFSLEGAEEALGRLERFLERQKEKEKLTGKDNF